MKQLFSVDSLIKAKLELRAYATKGLDFFELSKCIDEYSKMSVTERIEKRKQAVEDLCHQSKKFREEWKLNPRCDCPVYYDLPWCEHVEAAFNDECGGKERLHSVARTVVELESALVRLKL